MGLEGTSVVRVGSGCCCWKGWKGRRLEEDWKGRRLDPDVVAGRGLEGLDPDGVGRDVSCKGWIRMLLLEGLEGTSIGRGLEGTSIGSGCCCWKGWKGRRSEGLDVDWKGWIRTLLLEGLEGTPIGRVGRRLEGLDPDVAAGRVGRDVNWKGIGSGVDWKGLIRRQLKELEGFDPNVVVGRVGFDVVAGRDVN